ncbi:MAG: hypothetical protein U0V75_16335 [Ferruginibacter sp.]
MKKTLFIIALAAITAASCKKVNTSKKEICTDAVVRWGGDPAADGTGWHLYVASDNITAFKYPDNLPDDFKVAGLQVAVCYEPTDRDFICFCMQPLPKMVHITFIKRH